MGTDDADHRRRLSDAARLVAGRAPALALFARQWSADAAAAQDVVQSVLVSLLSLANVPADPLAWAYRAVRNEAIDGARASARRRRRERSVAPVDWFEPSTDDRLDAASAEAAVRRLPDELREVVVLRVWGELGFAAIAEVVGCSVSTAHARHAAGLKQLRDLMEPSWRTKQNQ
jgi:RNA polymerase sigma-70 factor (ECF subfamily)